MVSSDNNRRVTWNWNVWLSPPFMILASIVIIIISIAYGGHEKAAQDMDFAGMVVSVVLALVAIIYTMVEGGSQRESAAKLQAAIEDLNESIITVKSLEQSTQEHWAEVRTLVSDLTSAIQKNDLAQAKVIKKIDQITSKGTTSSADDLRRDLQELKREVQRTVNDRINLSSSNQHRKIIYTYSVNNYSKAVKDLKSERKNLMDLVMNRVAQRKSDEEILNDMRAYSGVMGVSFAEDDMMDMIRRARDLQDNA